MRRWLGLFAVVVAVAACGGGGEDGPATFTSDDGVVTVDLPPGAAPDGFTGTISLSDSSALGVDTSDVESVVLVYELGPDGTEFNEPVTVTFRIPPALGGFDPTQGLPITLILIADDAGGFEQFEDSNSYFDGDVLVVEGTTTHFSEAVIVLSGVELYLSMNPPGLMQPAKSTFTVSMSTRRRANEEIEFLFIGRTDFAASGALEVVSVEPTDAATLRCTKKGPGSVEATVFGDLADALPIATLAQLLTGGGGDFIGRLSLEIECVDEPVDEPPPEDPPPPTGSDPKDQANGKDSSKVKEGEGDIRADVKQVSYEPGPSGENCFGIVFYGDGESASSEASNLIINFEVTGPEEWQARAEWFQGEPDQGKVWLGPKTSGRDTLEGATVTPVWVDSDTLQTCVDSGDTTLAVGTFGIMVDIFIEGDHFYDSAEGIAES